MDFKVLAKLRCHDATRTRDVRSMRVMVRRTKLELELSFRAYGNISSICLTPANGPPGSVELWRHTCFEAFVAIEGEAAYHEFNFAPSGEWCVYAFRAYRDPISAENALRSPIIALNATNKRIEMDARIALSDLSVIHSVSPLRIGLSAIIESQAGSLSYWALRHRRKPDFHHADAFALRLKGLEY